MQIALIGLFQAIVVAVIGGLFARDSKKRKATLDNAETRAVLRAEESRLAMKLMSADVSLTIATALALKEGRTNGKMETALSNAEKAEQEYYNFINTIASKQIAT